MKQIGAVLRGVVLVAILVAGGLACMEANRTSGDILLEPAPQQKLVALTFDDGPRPITTQRLLDGLNERGVKATFFLIGQYVECWPEVVERMAREGHQIGIHTYDHVIVSGLDSADVQYQLEQSRRSIYRLLGERDLWFRPPYGAIDANTARWADSPIILWSVDPEDWRDMDRVRICRHVVEHVEDGDIILLHDIYPSSVDAALAAVDELSARGFCFVTVQELLECRGITPQLGQTYRMAR